MFSNSLAGSVKASGKLPLRLCADYPCAEISKGSCWIGDSYYYLFFKGKKFLEARCIVMPTPYEKELKETIRNMIRDFDISTETDTAIIFRILPFRGG